jgi:predicted lysophospholipase L1 biosynthesis ABC-type transport system permease subunit
MVRAIEMRRPGLIAMGVLGLALFVRQPCDSPFPNLWTIGALVLFAAAVAAAPLFVEAAESAEDRGTRFAE